MSKQQGARGLALTSQIVIFCMMVIFSLSSTGAAQVPYFFPWSANPYFYPIVPIYAPPVPPPFFIQPYPYFIDPIAAPVTRAPAATTIIITNPTTGTVSVTTVAPATTAAATTTATVSPIVSTLASLYAQALYSPAAISTANPLLFAVLSNLFI
ncbi:MAG: hypothetical protein K6U11_13660 [bacterium]|nr:hypothetical protein [bacterium]